MRVELTKKISPYIMAKKKAAKKAKKAKKRK